MKFDFSEAKPEDDAAIRRLLRDNPMPGPVTVAFEREPDYFLGHNAMGERCITLKTVERESGKIAAILCMAASDRFINGRVQSVGYIGGIRIDRNYQGMMLPLKAFPYIRDLARKDWPRLWFGAIVDGNPTASALFVNRPRSSFPQPTEVTAFNTLALPTRPFSRSDKSNLIQILSGDLVGWEEIAGFLNKEGTRREFSPFLKTGYFSENRGTPGLEPGDFLVAYRAGEIFGVCALWDQSSYRQTVVHEYRGWLGRVRPVFNLSTALTGMKRLPEIGDQISSAYLSFAAVSGDDPQVFTRLIDAALGTAHSKGKDYLLAGFSVKDPLLPIAGKFRHILYRSIIYAFSFDGPLTDSDFDRKKTPHFEGGAL